MLYLQEASWPGLEATRQPRMEISFILKSMSPLPCQMGFQWMIIVQSDYFYVRLIPFEKWKQDM